MPITATVKALPHFAGLACLAALVATGCNDLTQSAPLPIAQALRLGRGAAESTIYTRIKGVVSFADRKSGEFVVEDSTGGVRLALAAQQLLPDGGDVVEAAGLLQVTGETGVMLEPELSILGRAKRPAGIPISLEHPEAEANRTVILQGVVESVELERSGIQSVVIRAAGHRAIASMMLDLPDSEKLVDAEMEVTGVLARAAGQAGEPLIWSRNNEYFKILRPAPLPTSISVTPIAKIVNLPPHLVPGHRVRFRGDLTATPSGSFRMNDGTGAIPIRFDTQSGSDIPALPARNVDLVGFISLENGEAWLDDAEPVVHAREGVKVIRSAIEVHQLPTHAAAMRQPVSLRAVVTYYNPPLLFVQDATDGMFVYSKATNKPLKSGDLVDIEGESLKGDFAPSVGNPEIRLLGRAALPAPVSDIESVFTGKQDCRWVQFNGVVQKVLVTPEETLLSLIWGTHSFKAHVPRAAGSLEALLDREVTIRGAVGALYNDRRQFLGVQLFVPGVEFITLKDKGALILPAANRSIKSLLQFSAAEPGGHRVRVEGIVTLANPFGPTWIRDNTGGLEVISHEKILLTPGDVVSVLGYPQSRSFGPAMRDAQFTKIRSGNTPNPIRISVDDAMRGTYESQFVEIEGVVVNSSLQAANRSLTLRANPYFFEAQFASLRKANSLAGVSPGAQVLVRGIASAIVDQRQDTIVPRGFQILMRSPDDLTVVKAASRLTTKRLGIILAVTLLLVLGAVCWIMLLRRSVRLQTGSLVQKTRELQNAVELANDALNRAREAETIEADRKAILEMVAKDESIESVMRAVCVAASRHLKISACSVQLTLADGARLAQTSEMPEGIAAALSCANVDSIAESSRFLPAGQLSTDPVWMAALPLLSEASLNYYCASAIHRNRTGVGFLIAFAPEPGGPSPLQTPSLESWSGIASLAVERRGFFDQLSYRAQHDNLTGLVNRASLYERMEIELAKTSQEGKGLSVIYLDLDGFKKINDRHGHDAGDAVLREVSRRLTGSIRRTDIAARVGGDEFVVVLPGVDNRDEAAQVSRLITDAVRLPVYFGNKELETGTSVGIAVYPVDGTKADVLLKSADEEMYRQKGALKARGREQGVFV